MKKTIFMMSLMLGLLVSVSAFTACSSDDDDSGSEIKMPNAQGVYICENVTGKIDIENIYLWISNDYVKKYYYEIVKDYYPESIPYYPLTMPIVYEMKGEKYGGDGVNEDTKSATISYIKSHGLQYKYRYIAKGVAGLLLFNRVSDVNY